MVASAIDTATILDRELHFLAEPWFDDAVSRAADIDRLPTGERGALAGVPILIKSGTSLETPLVERLVDAGAVPIGTSTRPDPEAVCQAWGWNGTDHTRNPWRTDRSSGGSSAGSAAGVAAGVVPLATGGDSAGSLRIPAAFCGVIGLKPTPGRTPRPRRSLAQLTTSGVIAADLDDLVLAVGLASGSHRRDPLALPPWRHSEDRTILRRVAFSADLGYAAPDRVVAETVRRRLAELDASGVIDLVDVPISVGDPEQAWLSLYALDRGESVDAGRLAEAVAYRQEVDQAFGGLFSGIDVLVTPATPQVAFACGDYEQNMHAGDLAWIFNVTGHPAMSVPVGLVEGLPVGAQVVAAPHQDSMVIEAARSIMTSIGCPPVHSSRTVADVRH